MKRTLFAIRLAVAAGIDLWAARVCRALDRWAGRPRWSREEAERKAFLVGYRGPIDPDGQWLEDLSARRIDHDGNPRKPRAT